MRTTSRILVYDDPTLAAYRRHATAAIANWRRFRRPSKFLRRFAQQSPRGARVLDYGCGIGTDLAWMRQQGLWVEGLDGTEAFAREARRRNPGARITCARFETAQLPPARYDGLWCNASLIHVHPERLPAQLQTLRAALKPGGLLGITLAWGRRKGLIARDWIPGRYLAGYTKPEALAFFRDWTVHDCRVVSHDGRRGRWLQILVQYLP